MAVVPGRSGEGLGPVPTVPENEPAVTCVPLSSLNQAILGYMSTKGMRAGFFVFALLCMVAPLTALSQASRPALSMHRTQVGEPDSTGWMVAASTDGGFSVQLPLKFNDFTVTETDPKSAALRTHVVGAKSQEGIKFTASRIVYRKAADSAKSFFSKFEKAGSRSSRPRGPLQVAGRKAVDSAERKGNAVVYQRAVLLESDLLLMIVEAPREHEALVEGLTKRFFDSLRISTP